MEQDRPTLHLKSTRASGCEVISAGGPRRSVRCTCGHLIFDGIVIRARFVRLLPNGHAQAKCRCKQFSMVPLGYQELPTPGRATATSTSVPA